MVKFLNVIVALVSVPWASFASTFDQYNQRYDCTFIGDDTKQVAYLCTNENKQYVVMFNLRDVVKRGPFTLVCSLSYLQDKHTSSSLLMSELLLGYMQEKLPKMKAKHQLLFQDGKDASYQFHAKGQNGSRSVELSCMISISSNSEFSVSEQAQIEMHPSQDCESSPIAPREIEQKLAEYFTFAQLSHDIENRSQFAQYWPLLSKATRLPRQMLKDMDLIFSLSGAECGEPNPSVETKSYCAYARIFQEHARVCKIPIFARNRIFPLPSDLPRQISDTYVTFAERAERLNSPDDILELVKDHGLSLGEDDDTSRVVVDMGEHYVLKLVMSSNGTGIESLVENRLLDQVDGLRLIQEFGYRSVSSVGKPRKRVTKRYTFVSQVFSKAPGTIMKKALLGLGEHKKLIPEIIDLIRKELSNLKSNLSRFGMSLDDHPRNYFVTSDFKRLIQAYRTDGLPELNEEIVHLKTVLDNHRVKMNGSSEFTCAQNSPCHDMILKLINHFRADTLEEYLPEFKKTMQFSGNLADLIDEILFFVDIKPDDPFEDEPDNPLEGLDLGDFLLNHVVWVDPVG